MVSAIESLAAQAGETYIYIYVYIHIYVYIYRYIPTYTCVYIYIYTYTYVYVYMYIHIYIYIHTNTYTCIGYRSWLQLAADAIDVTGSRYWASQGLELFQIHTLARWGFAVMLRYVAEAPLQSITTDIKKRTSVHEVWDAISELDKTLLEVRLEQSEEGQVRSRTEEKASNKRPS